jgi:hypothetical protein
VNYEKEPLKEGQIFGDHIVQYKVNKKESYKCICKNCGKTKYISKSKLLKGLPKNCSCIYNISQEEKRLRKKIYDKEWKKRNKIKINKSRLKSIHKLKEINPSEYKLRSKKANLKSKYNITYEEYNTLITKCNNHCEICNIYLINPHIDHNHETGQIRGILCNNCNRGIGLLQDNSEVLRNAALYLDRTNNGQNISENS